MSEPQSESLWQRCGDTETNRRNLRRLLGALAVWAVCFVGASYLIDGRVVPAGPPSWLLAAVPTLAAAVAVLAFVRFVRQADELQRLIQLRALALGFGAVWLALSGYPLFEELGAPPLDAGDYTLVMAVAYMLGIFVGWQRHR